MPKKITVSDHDYDRLRMRAGGEDKIKFVVKNLLDLSDLAALDVRRYDEWKAAVEGTGAKTPLPLSQS